MAELVKVTALRPHRSGYAGGNVEKDGAYSVPASAVAGLVRQKLIADPHKPAKRKAASKAADEIGAGAEDNG